jgi:hypothetical protein
VPGIERSSEVKGLFEVRQPHARVGLTLPYFLIALFSL